MKPYVVAVGLLVLVASLFGVGKSFTSPTEKEVEKAVKVLGYEQDGAFNYTVVTKPAFFYGNAPPSTPEPTPPIPIKFIERFDMSFSYQSSAASNENIEINAILENPNSWKKKVNVVPQKTYSGNASIPFSVDLKYFQNLADTINKEIPLTNIQSYNLTMQAIVSGGELSSGGTDQHSIQLLPIIVTGAFVKIGGNLTYAGSDAVGTFDYQVKLSDNTLFGPATLTPPTSPANTPGKVLGPGDTIFSRLVDSMNVSFTYSLTANKAIRQIAHEVKIEAMAESPEKWSKTYVLVPPTQEDGDFTVTFPLDIQQFTDVFNTIRQESGVSASSQNLILQATVHTVAQTEQGTIDNTYTQSIKTDLGTGILTWTGDMMKSQPGSIEVPGVALEPSRLWGRPVLEVRILSVSITAIMFALLVFILVYLRRRTETALHAEKKDREIGQKYRAMIVELNERPENNRGETVLTADSLEELIKVSQGLLKPVNHWADADEHVYWVYDESRRYEYRLTHEIRSSEDEKPAT